MQGALRIDQLVGARAKIPRHAKRRSANRIGAKQNREDDQMQGALRTGPERTSCT